MKKIISLLLSFVLFFGLSTTAFAKSTSTPEATIAVVDTDQAEPVRAEETEWYVRITETGLIQKRLWSITYGYWKTDWITVGHV